MSTWCGDGLQICPSQNTGLAVGTLKTLSQFLYNVSFDCLSMYFMGTLRCSVAHPPTQSNSLIAPLCYIHPKMVFMVNIYCHPAKSTIFPPLATWKSWRGVWRELLRRMVELMQLTCSLWIKLHDGHFDQSDPGDVTEEIHCEL